MTTRKTCTKCGETKDLSDFYLRDGKPIAACKDCTRAASNGYRKQHPPDREKRLAYERGWNTRNREKRNAITRAWQERNREKYQAYRAEYRKRNRELIRERWRKWATENTRDPEAARRYYAKRRALEAEAYVEDVPFDYIVQRDLGICGICGLAVMEASPELDHIVPLAAGGTHEKTNVQFAHRACNREKSNRADYTKQVLATTPSGQ